MKLTERILNGIKDTAVSVTKNTITYLILFGALNGCGKIEEPKREDYNQRDFILAGYVFTDRNNDGNIDHVRTDKRGMASSTICVDSLQLPYLNWEINSGFSFQMTYQMSPELIKVATDAKNASDDLLFVLDKEMYERKQK